MQKFLIIGNIDFEQYNFDAVDKVGLLETLVSAKEQQLRDFISGCEKDYMLVNFHDIITVKEAGEVRPNPLNVPSEMNWIIYGRVEKDLKKLKVEYTDFKDFSYGVTLTSKEFIKLVNKTKNPFYCFKIVDVVNVEQAKDFNKNLLPYYY